MVMSTFILMGFNDATLAIHLKQFHLSHTNTGLPFIICAGRLESLLGVDEQAGGEFTTSQIKHCRILGNQRLAADLEASVAQSRHVKPLESVICDQSVRGFHIYGESIRETTLRILSVGNARSLKNYDEILCVVLPEQMHDIT